MVRAIVILAVVGFVVYTLIDCAQTPRPDVETLPKPLWLLLIVLLPVIGGIGWLLLGRGGRPLGRGKPAPRPRGPDDDPDFLGGL